MTSESIEMDILTPNQRAPDQNYMDLLKFTIYNKCNELERLLILKKYQIDLKKKYGKPFEKTIIEIACMEYAFKINFECVFTLLKYGADKDLALISAGIGGNPKLLKFVLQYLNNESHNFEKSPVILKIIENMNKRGYVHQVSETKYAGCISLLIKEGVDINLKTEPNVSSPNAIFLAAKYNYAQIVEAILDLKKDTVDLDCYKEASFGTARDIILMNKLYKNILPPEKKHKKDKIFILQKYIDINDEYTFITEYVKIKNMGKMDVNYEKDLLIYAIEKGAIDIVRYLICAGLDVNSYDTKTPFPLFVACKKGYYKIAKIVIDCTNGRFVSEAFVKMLQTVYFHQKCLDQMDINHEKCYNILFDSDKLDINYNNGKPALYYAIQKQPDSMVSRMLDKGASLAQLLDLNEKTSWMVFVSPDILEKHLNKCIKFGKVNEITNAINVTVDFSTLLPVEKKTNTENTYYFDANHLIEENNNDKNSNMIESTVLEYMSDKSEYYPVLQHPLIHIYLYLKWQKLRFFFYLNLAWYFIYSSALIFYLVLPYTNFYDRAIAFVILGFIAAALIFLSVKELIEVNITGCDYFKNSGNILDIVMLVLTIGMLFAEMENTAIFKQASAFVIVFTTMQSIYILGRHIDFLFNTITMLRSVTITLIKLILPYSALIVAFSFSFFILFKIETTRSGEEPKNHFFSNPVLSLFKTSLMLTGEFEVSNIDFSTYPITSPLLFIMFVFLMNIVLFGVFTALAINDVQQVKQIQSLITKIKQIVYMDKMFNLFECAKMDRTIKMDLKQSQLYLKNERAKIKVEKKVVHAMKKIVEDENKLPKPILDKQCPALRHSTIKRRKIKRQMSNVDQLANV